MKEKIMLFRGQYSMDELKKLIKEEKLELLSTKMESTKLGITPNPFLITMLHLVEVIN